MFINIIISLFCLCSMFILLACSKKEFSGELIQTTTYGKVKGVIDKKNDVLFWKGIPFGGDTSNENRWKKPSDPNKWFDILDASKSGDIAIQESDGHIVGSEKALNLDIYRPNNNKYNLPVFFYIHSGNNQTGKSEQITGNSFVSDLDAVFISINHRLGILGFNPLKALNTGGKYEDSGNYALLDIAKSLDWVKENIESFGGDPKNITLSGFSSGGRNVMAILISPLFKNKFQKAISFSGGMTIADKDDSAKVFAKSLAPLAVEDGQKENKKDAYNWLLSNDISVKDYLYGLSADRLSALMTDADIRMSVFPHLYNDGTVLPKEGFDTNNYNDVPLLMLTGSNEFSIFTKSDPYFSSHFEDRNLNISLEKKAAYKFTNKYGSALYSLFNVDEPAIKIYDKYNSSIYATEISYGDNASVVHSELSSVGAFHGVFIPLLDNDSQNFYDLIGDFFQTDGATHLSMTFKSYLSNFLKTGNPNGNKLTEWKPWTEENRQQGSSILILDADKEKAISYMDSKEFSYKEILNHMENDKTVNEKTKKDILSKVLNGRWFSKGLDRRYKNSSLWIE